MYSIKSEPADFVVTEQIQLQLDDSGQYAYYWLRKESYTTQRALDRIAGFLKKKVRDVGFAGNKDKVAVTKQAVSIKDPDRRVGAKTFDSFNSDIVSLEYIGRGKKPVSLGDLDGNKFEIVLRDCEKEPRAVEQVVNYFDEQRFSRTNVEVGRAIVKGDFKKACELIDFDDVAQHLEKSPTDLVGAIKKIPLKVRLLFVHSYQSWLWNEAVREYLQCKYKPEEVSIVQYSQGELVFPKESVENDKVPIIGFGSEDVTGEIGRIVQDIMKKESITKRDFVIRSMPELSAEGGERDLAVAVSDLVIEKKGDKEFLLRFSLPKGSYATMVVKQMMEG